MHTPLQSLNSNYTLPDYVNGQYFTSGPSKFEMGDVKVDNVIDGFGRINKYDINNGTLSFSSKLINSTWKDTCEKHNDIEPLVLFMETVPPRWKSKIPGMNMKGMHDYPDNIFVQVGVQPDMKTFWTSTDQPAPLKIDPVNLTQEKLL